MKPLPHEYRAVDASYPDRAPIKVVVEQAIPCSAERLFEIFEDPDAWGVWLGLNEVVWTRPIGPDTARRIKMGPAQFDEQFTAWERGRHMRFYFSAGTSRLFGAFFEDYRVEPDGPDACRVTWTAAFELRGAARVLGPIVRPLFAMNARRAYRKLAEYAPTWRPAP